MQMALTCKQQYSTPNLFASSRAGHRSSPSLSLASSCVAPSPSHSHSHSHCHSRSHAHSIPPAPTPLPLVNPLPNSHSNPLSVSHSSDTSAAHLRPKGRADLTFENVDCVLLLYTPPSLKGPGSREQRACIPQPDGELNH